MQSSHMILPRGSNVLDYGRLSKDEDKEMASLTNQMDMLRDYADTNGYNVIGEFFDDNVSGMTFEREGLEAMLDVIEEGNVQAILVKDLSRLGRHRIKTAILIETLERKGVRVISVTEGIDTFDENDDLMIGIKQIMNDFYAKDIQRKIKYGYRQKQKVGLIMIPPFGYYKDKNTGEVQLVEEAAETVKQIFNLFLEGYGYKKIAQFLNREGAKTPSTFQKELLGKRIGANKTKVAKDGKWNEKTIERILKDEAYVGTLVNHKSERNKIKKTFKEVPVEQRFRHEGVFPRIIEDTVWQQASAVINARKNTCQRASSNSKIHRYAGLLRCGECEASFVGKRRNLPTRSYVEYVCSTYHRMGKETCTNHRIEESVLDEIIYTELESLVELAKTNCDEVKTIIDNYISNKDKAAGQANELRLQLTKLQEEASKKVGYLATHPDLEEMLMPDIQNTKNEIQKLKTRIERLSTQEVSYTSRLSEIESSTAMLREIVKSRTISNTTLLTLVERIIISENEDQTLNLQVKLRAPFKSHFLLAQNIVNAKQAEKLGDNSGLATKLAEILDQIA